MLVNSYTVYNTFSNNKPNPNREKKANHHPIPIPIPIPKLLVTMR